MVKMTVNLVRKLAKPVIMLNNVKHAIMDTFIKIINA